MRRSFHLCASLLLVLTWLWRVPIAGRLLQSGYSGGPAVADTVHDTAEDPESRLARGEKLLLACAGLFELELLNGVSDTTAAHILAARPTLSRPHVPTHVALQMVHGLGIKKAQEFARFLDISTPCPTWATKSELSPLAPPSDPGIR